jgi:hypothetical protein
LRCTASGLGEDFPLLIEKKGALANSRSARYEEVDDASTFDEENFDDVSLTSRYLIIMAGNYFKIREFFPQVISSPKLN